MLSFATKRPATFVAVVCLAFFAAYEASVQLFAFTSDAYLMSDIVIVSSEIEGPVSRLGVQDNDPVQPGQILFEIEPTPYKLDVDAALAAVKQAQANLALANDELAASQATLASAQAVETNAKAELGRARTLSRDGFTSGAALDSATKDEATASAGIEVAQADLSVSTRRIAVANASIATAQAALAKAQYEFSKTSVAAVEAGWVAPFTTRQGDYLQPGTQVMAIVTARRRRIVANVAERHLSHLRAGQRAWVTLGTAPWRVHGGRLTSIARGVARSPDQPQVVPYVEPSTDWVRLPRRFPVEIVLDDWPAELPFHFGADARVLVWF